MFFLKYFIRLVGNTRPRALSCVTEIPLRQDFEQKQKQKTKKWVGGGQGGSPGPAQALGATVLCICICFTSLPLLSCGKMAAKSPQKGQVLGLTLASSFGPCHS